MCLVVSGISVFAEMIKGRNVVIYSDNTGIDVSLGNIRVGLSIVWFTAKGAEAATRKGSTKNFDQHSLVHCMWKKFAELKVGVWVRRVPTDDNIADCPSRPVGSCILVWVVVLLAILLSGSNTNC